jgi:hypothetical protein
MLKNRSLAQNRRIFHENSKQQISLQAVSHNAVASPSANEGPYNLGTCHVGCNLNLARLTSFIQTNTSIIYADFCENNNELSVSIKGAGEFLGKLNDY